VPSLNSQQSLDLLEKLQEEQSKKFRSLASKLGPLSPNGHIPGLHDASNVPAPDPEFDFDSWLNSTNPGTDYFEDTNFDLGGASAAGTHGVDANDLFGDVGGGGLGFNMEDPTGTAFTDFGTSDPAAAAAAPHVGNGEFGLDAKFGHTRVRSVSSAGAGSPVATASPASPATVATIPEGGTPAEEGRTLEQPAKRRRRNG
jgi:hypothetical protein